MMQREERNELVGRRFGRWTVLDEWTSTGRGERKVLCRCECGTERFVLERSLLYGGSRSCGCLTRERTSEALSLDLTGRRFGWLTVLERRPSTGRSRAGRWLCQCDCGNQCEAAGNLLTGGKKTDCGCRSVKNYAYANIEGQRFHRLVALYRLDERDKNGSVIWHCQCDCGNEIDVSYNNLKYGNMRSCGCRRREHDQELSGLLTHVAGTSLDILRSRKVPKNNTTGVKGVYLVKGKYLAKIVFQKKQYLLGSYDDLDSAQAARREAEEIINEQVVAFYEKWKRRAEEDPEWAEQNPIEISVQKNEANRIALSLKPDLDG